MIWRVTQAAWSSFTTKSKHTEQGTYKGENKPSCQWLSQSLKLHITATKCTDVAHRLGRQHSLKKKNCDEKLSIALWVWLYWQMRGRRVRHFIAHPAFFKKVQTQHWNSITLNYSISTINHIRHKTLIFRRTKSYFTKHKQFLAPASSACTHLLSFSDRRLHFSFSAGPESEPQGWSLITREWAANGCLHRFTTPDPHTTLRVSMATCSRVARGLLVGSEWGIMIGRWTWPRCFLRHLTRHTAY